MRLELARDGKVTTHLTVERSETLDLLQRDARQLERALNQAGLDSRDGSLTFSLKDQGHGQEGHASRALLEPESAPDESEPEAEPEEALRPAVNASGGLDIRI